MRNLKTILKAGGLFLCLGGWVYSGQLRADVLASQAKDGAQPNQAALNDAVRAAAATPTPNEQLQNPQVTNPVIGPGTPAATEPKKIGDADASFGIDGTVERFNAKDLDVSSALLLISDRAHQNIIASKNVKGTVTVSLYNVTFSQLLDAILKPNGLDYIKQGGFIYVYTSDEIAEINKHNRKTVNTVYRLKYMTAADANNIIKPLLSSTGVVAVTATAGIGLPSGIADTGGDAYPLDDILVVNDFPENQAEVVKTLAEIDVRPKQVLIESTILNATLHENTAVGIDLVSLSGIDFSTLSSATLTNNANSGTASTGSTVPINGPGGLVNNFLGNKPQANIGTNFTSQVPDGGLSVGFLSNSIAVFLKALEDTTDTTIIANPKILAINKHKGEVHIGAELGYLTTTTSQTTTQQTVQFIDVGTKLVFRPFITEDGYIRMEVHPEESSGSIDGKGVPQTVTTEITSNIMIRDGRTVVIGGLFNETTTADRGQVPVLGNIPVLGVPFRRTTDDTVRSETIILLTPHIINDDTALAEESQKKAEDVTRMMLGNRAGLQPWGRDRMAQMWYSKALEELEKNNKEKALMYCDWALNTNPRFIEAIKLREKLTNKKVEEAEESSIDSFVHDVLKDDAATTPDKGGSGNYPPMAPATAPAKN